jgi:hypothetical protein
MKFRKLEREKFRMDAALRLFTAQPTKTVAEIAAMANEITEHIFGEEQQENNGERWWTDEVDSAPVHNILGYIGRNCLRSQRYPSRLTKAFKKCKINTIGDLLRVWRATFKKTPDVGVGSVVQIDYALDKLYNIKSW